MVKNLSIMQETWVQSLGQKDLLEKEMATHSSIPAGKIPCTEEPGGLQSTGLQSRTCQQYLQSWSIRQYSHEAEGDTAQENKRRG